MDNSNNNGDIGDNDNHDIDVCIFIHFFGQLPFLMLLCHLFLCIKKCTPIFCFGHTVAHVLHLQIQVRVVFLWQCATIHSTYTFLLCREIRDIKMGLVFCSVLPVLRPFFPPSSTAFKSCIQICGLNRDTDCKLLKNFNARCNSVEWLLIPQIPVFWDVMLCCFFMELELQKMETLCSFKVMETTCPVTWHDIPGDQNLQTTVKISNLHNNFLFILTLFFFHDFHFFLMVVLGYNRWYVLLQISFKYYSAKYLLGVSGCNILSVM